MLATTLYKNLKHLLRWTSQYILWLRVEEKEFHGQLQISALWYFKGTPFPLDPKIIKNEGFSFNPQNLKNYIITPKNERKRETWGSVGSHGFFVWLNRHRRKLRHLTAFSPMPIERSWALKKCSSKAVRNAVKLLCIVSKCIYKSIYTYK